MRQSERSQKTPKNKSVAGEQNTSPYQSWAACSDAELAELWKRSDPRKFKHEQAKLRRRYWDGEFGEGVVSILPRAARPFSKHFRVLAELYEQTGDPALWDALKIIMAYGLEGDDWQKRAQAIYDAKNDERIAAKVVEVSKLTGLKLTPACKVVAAIEAIPAQSFDAARHRVRLAYERSIKRTNQTSGNATGESGNIEIQLRDGRRARVPNNRYWREKIWARDVILTFRPLRPINFGGVEVSDEFEPDPREMQRAKLLNSGSETPVRIPAE